MIADPVARLVGEVVAVLQASPQELAWTSYQATTDLIDELRQLADRAATGDRAAVAHLRVLFAPTGTLQTISIDSGWADAYLDLAERFDRESAAL